MENFSLDTEFVPNEPEFKSKVSSGTDDIYQKAYNLYESHRYSDVISLIQGDSYAVSTARGRVLIANSYLGLGDTASAVSNWQKAIDISPLEHTAYVNLANHYYSTGKIHEAIYNWTIATTIVPESPNVNLNLALAYDKINSRIKATKYFERYLKYETNIESAEYKLVKANLTKMTAKADFYARKVQEFKNLKDLKAIAALYLKIVSTYALVPPIYSNIADIFEFDKNYEKALEFYQVVYLYFPYTNKILIEIANLCYRLKHLSYAYVYYTRALKTLPEGTSYYNRVVSLLESMESVKNDSELVQKHYDLAKEAADRCEYEVAIDEYENYMILTESDSMELKQIIDRYKIFVNPEPFVITVLYNQIPDLMNKKKLETCVEVCDRIISMAKDHSAEVVNAIKYKTECKRILLSGSR